LEEGELDVPKAVCRKLGETQNIVQTNQLLQEAAFIAIAGNPSTIGTNCREECVQRLHVKNGRC